MENITRAFVFARGGSKGIPKKNLQKVGNIHLVGHSIIMAKKIKEIQKIYVSTDSHEIAEISKEYGAEIIMRPKELACDNSPEIFAWKHAIKFSIEKDGIFNKFLSLPPTSPLRSIEDIKKCLNSLKNNIDLILTISESKRNPWFNMVVENKKSLLSLVNTETKTFRRQDAPECFDVTTVAYVAEPKFILRTNSIWEGNIFGVKIPEARSIDIDTPFDLQMAKLIFNYLK